MKYRVENRVGRLIEFRGLTNLTAEDIPDFMASVRAAVLKPKTKVVICCDLRSGLVMAPEVANMIVSLLRSDNQLMERAGYLLNDNAVFSLQLDRIVREAQNEDRRTFRDASKLVEFLLPVLSAEEQTRLREFLNEWPPIGERSP